MKNLDPKVVVPLCAVAIVAALFFILRSAGVGQPPEAPPPLPNFTMPSTVPQQPAAPQQ